MARLLNCFNTKKFTIKRTAEGSNLHEMYKVTVWDATKKAYTVNHVYTTDAASHTAYQIEMVRAAGKK